MMRGCGGLCTYRHPGGVVCPRVAGHTGKHMRGIGAAWYADRYANTSGYRRQRRKRGYQNWPARYALPWRLDGCVGIIVGAGEL